MTTMDKSIDWGVGSDSTSIIYKVGEGMLKLAKLWKEYVESR